MPNLHSRRTYLQMVSCGTALLTAGSSLQAQSEPEYTVLTLAARNFPSMTIATCSDLENSIQSFGKELNRLSSNFTGVGKEVMDRVMARREELKRAIDSAQNMQANAKVDEAFAQINLGVSILFWGLGCVFAAPVSVGVLAGTSVLAGAGMFAVQAYFKKGAVNPTFVMGYARDRTLMFTELGISNAGSSASRVIGNSVKAATLLIGGYEIYNAKKDEALALETIKQSLLAIKSIDDRFTQFGKNTASWANIYQQHLLAARDSLRAYVSATKKDDCMLRGPGPVLKKP